VDHDQRVLDRVEREQAGISGAKPGNLLVDEIPCSRK
jgi:hypothetical protein